MADQQTYTSDHSAVLWTAFILGLLSATITFFMLKNLLPGLKQAWKDNQPQPPAAVSTGVVANNSSAHQLLLQAQKLSDENKYSELKDIATQALNVASNATDKADAHYWLGVYYYESKLYSQAETEYKAALTFNPKFVSPTLEIARIYEDKGLMQTALEYAQKAIVIDPNSAQAHNEAGLILANLNRRSEALAEFQKAVELNPNSVTYRQNLQIIKQPAR